MKKKIMSFVLVGFSGLYAGRTGNSRGDVYGQTIGVNRPASPLVPQQAITAQKSSVVNTKLETKIASLEKKEANLKKQIEKIEIKIENKKNSLEWKKLNNKKNDLNIQAARVGKKIGDLRRKE